jgi:hypothetical protein
MPAHAPLSPEIQRSPTGETLHEIPFDRACSAFGGLRGRNADARDRRVATKTPLQFPTASIWWVQPRTVVVAGPFDADGFIAQLDQAGVRRAVVLSIAYIFGDDRAR